MRTPYRLWGRAVLGIGALLSLSSVGVQAEPIRPPALPHMSLPARNSRLQMYRVDNVTLDYAGATQNSTEVLDAKVSVTIKDVSFLAALDTLLNASDKTCPIECRQLYAQRVSLKVKEASLGGLLDSLAKLGGGRLYVLPNKLILAPASALTEDENKKAKTYAVLLNAATLPNTPEAKALLKPNNKGKTILDIANTPLNIFGGVLLGMLLQGPIDPYAVPDNTFSPKLIGNFSTEELNARVNFIWSGINYGDALASYAHSVGCELYLTPERFIICAPEHLNDPENRQWTQGAIPAFTSSSINIILDETLARGS